MTIITVIPLWTVYNIPSSLWDDHMVPVPGLYSYQSKQDNEKKPQVLIYTISFIDCIIIYQLLKQHYGINIEKNDLRFLIIEVIFLIMQ